MNSQAQSHLKEFAIVVDFDGGYFNWNRRDSKVEKSVATANSISPNAGRYLKNLFLACDTPLHRVRQCVQHARAQHELLTVPWEFGRRLLLNANHLAYTKTLQEARNNLESANDLLAASYEALKVQAQASLGPLYRDSDYPSISTILRSNYIRWTFHPVSAPSDVQLKLESSLVASIRADVEATQQTQFTDAVNSVWERLYRILENAVSNLAKNGTTEERFRTEWYDRLQTLLPVLKGLNLNQDPALDSFADRCRLLLTHDADEFKTSLDIRSKTYDRARQIFEDMNSVFQPTPKEDNE